MLEEELIDKGNVSFFDIKRIKGRKVREKKRGDLYSLIYIYRTTVATRNKKRERENFFLLLIKKSNSC